MAETAYVAAQAECDAELISARDAQPEDMLGADGYLFVCPENLASMSGAMKEFFDRCYYPVLGRIEARPYAQLICAGSDGEGAVRQIARIAKGWRLKPVHDPLIICTHAQTEAEILALKTISDEDLELCADVGAAIAAGLTMGIY